MVAMMSVGTPRCLKDRNVNAVAATLQLNAHGMPLRFVSRWNYDRTFFIISGSAQILKVYDLWFLKDDDPWFLNCNDLWFLKVGDLWFLNAKQGPDQGRVVEANLNKSFQENDL